MTIDDELLKLVAGRPKKPSPRAGHPRYHHALDSTLETLWVLHNCPCSKRLAPALKENRHAILGSPLLTIDPASYDEICQMSASTIDRRLKGKHPEQSLKGITHTRPSKALKHLVPVRTWGDWQNALPGEFQADTVGHDGGNARGEFCFTLTLVDVASGWTELRALRNRAGLWIEKALADIKATLPLPFKALHTDNGGEFINLTVATFCAGNDIAFTRSRADRKNDNAYVECRNDDAVRRSVGYARFDSEDEYQALVAVYRAAVPFMNHFLPSMKLTDKHREGAKVIKRHDRAVTPYQRLMQSPFVSPEAKAALQETHEAYDMVELKLLYDEALDRLAELSKAKSSICPKL